MQTQTNHLINKQITHIHTTKFKDITVVFRFLIPLTKQHATLSALVLYMMEDRNIDYPSKKEMLAKKDELYGTTFTSGVIGYGQAMAIQIASKVMDPSYGDDPQLLIKHRDWLLTMIEKPLINQETLQEAKQQVQSALLRDLDYPQKYAQIKAFESLGESETVSINIDGDLAVLKDITIADCEVFHQQLLQEVNVSLYVIGNIDQETLVDLYDNQDILHVHKKIQTAYTLDLKNVGRKAETKTSTQTNLLKLYKTNVSIGHPLYLANRLISIALGQLPTSYLFSEIREKRSLCYSISSQYISFDGLCLISTGIDQQNIDAVSTLIDQQIQAVKEVDQTRLHQAKTMLINAINNSEDEILSMINLHYGYDIVSQTFDKVDLIARVQRVSSLDIFQAVSLWEPLLEYVVEGVPHENHQ